MNRLIFHSILLSTPALACTSADGLPDPWCTPGAIDPAVTQENLQETICVPDYSKSVRPSRRGYRDLHSRIADNVMEDTHGHLKR
jgi:hypothetical protein